MTVYISPYRRMATLREAMNRVIEDNMAETASTDREMMLAVDVLTDEDAYEIYAFVPGLEAEDVLVVGPSKTFSRYIRSVLPGLGDYNVVVRDLFALGPQRGNRSTGRILY
jgi:hypothetical protein